MNLVRLNKYLADQGIASRRKADELITQGLVKVNGVLVKEMGLKVNPEKDKVEVNQTMLKHVHKEFVYLKMNKPYDYECSKKPPKGVKSVYELLPKSTPNNVVSIGRLDKNSEGLLLFTNDGRLAYRLTHPKFDKEKEYEVTVDKNLQPEVLERLAKGVKILDRMTSPTTVTQISQRKFWIILKEGMNRQIRRMCRKVGYRVHKLKRFRIGDIELGGLKHGHVSKLSEYEMDYIKSILKDVKRDSN